MYDSDVMRESRVDVDQHSQFTLTNTHGFAGHKFGNASIARLHEFGRVLKRFTCSTIDLLNQLGELAGNVGSVAIEDGCIASADLTGVVKDDDLGVERRGFFGRVIL